MTTHSLHVGQGAAPVVAHRLVPLPDRGGGSLQQGDDSINAPSIFISICISLISIQDHC
jgi:hypothetical protein